MLLRRLYAEGKVDVPREYKKLIHFVKLMIDKLGAYSLIEHAEMWTQCTT